MNSINKLKLIYGKELKRVGNSKVYKVGNNKLICGNNIINREFDEVKGFGVLAYVKFNYHNDIINVQTGEVIKEDARQRFNIIDDRLITYDNGVVMAYTKEGYRTASIITGKKIFLIRTTEYNTIEVLGMGRSMWLKFENDRFIEWSKK